MYQRRDSGSQLRQVVVQHTPDFGIVQTRVAVHQDIPEDDELSLARHPRRQHRIEFRQLGHGLADVLQLALHRGPNQQVGLIPTQVESMDKTLDGTARVLDVSQERRWRTLHAWYTS